MESDTQGATLTPPGANGGELSEREHEILRLVATGASNKQIAQQLVISPNTVKVHLRNIFGKIGVATRTEATLYAIRQGLVQVAPDKLPVEEDNIQEPAAIDPVPAEPESQPPLTLPASVPAARRVPAWVWAAAGVVILVAALAAGWLLRQPGALPPATPAATATIAIARWQTAAAMPQAMSGLAAVTYETKVYTLGGATAAGVTGLTQSFDTIQNTWTQLAAKPTPVAEVQADIVGGLIYVPGGRTAVGQPTDALEAYNPRTNSWEQRARLPRALSGYAMVAFEGQLYVFGGWDGQHYLASAYTYNPALDKWTEAAAMPEARAYAGAAVAGGTIYVIGGENETGALANNEQYVPENSAAGGDPWRTVAPLPIKQSGIAITSIADIVYAIGGEGRPGELGAWEYFPQTDKWQALDAPAVAPTVRLAVAPIETHMFVAGGLQANTPSAQFLVYQAIYSTIFPIIGGP